MDLIGAWGDVQAIDHHCHPLRHWPAELTAVELRSAFTEAIDPLIAEHHVQNTAAYHDAIGRLAAELGCTPTESAVLSARNSEDPAAYSRRLLEKTGTGLMLVDHGFASDDAFTARDQERATGIPQREILRLETLAERLVVTSQDPREWLDAVRAALRDAVGRGAVGVKTICAYRSTLKLRPVDTDTLGVAFGALRNRSERGEPVRLSGDALCHALLFEAAEECMSLSVPLQVHCGFGDPDEDLAETSPLGLRPLLANPAYRGLRITLLHCYPYHREAAYLCSVFPDVYMDLSLTIPMAGLEGARAMREALGLCPVSKMLYATDATRYPEVYFVAAAAYREALAGALGELVDHNVMAADAAVAAGELVLRGNAERVYRLD
jgi:predicted TIM-barrel fold metal-dependent hydrolase